MISETQVSGRSDLVKSWFWSRKILEKPVNDIVSTKRSLAFSLIVLWAFGCVLLFYRHKGVATKQVVGVLSERSALAHQYLDVATSLAGFMRSQMETNIRLSSQGDLYHPQSDMLVDYPEFDVWGLDESQLRATEELVSKGMLTGSGRLRDNSVSVRNEINAALALELDIGRQTRHEMEFIWSYYTSSQAFMLISPFVNIQDFHFSPKLYRKPFWVPATPEQNPNRNTVISKLYDDAAGQGLMISVSSPVYYQNEFRGVVSLDIGVNKLKEVLTLGEVRGYSALVDEKWRYLASKQNFSVGDKYDTSESLPIENRLVETDAYTDFFIPVITDEVYLVHRIPNNGKRMLVLESMAFHLTLYTSCLIFVYLVVSLTLTLRRTEELAKKDVLTSLLNRRAMDAYGNALVVNERDAISTMMIDIDHFKSVNDSYGHYVGDVVIKEVAKILTQCSRKTDYLGRVGGEEFLLILPGTALDEACNLAERIRHRVEEAALSKKRLNITLSVGVVQRHEDDSYEALLKRSDNALYQAKRQGRNRVICGS